MFSAKKISESPIWSNSTVLTVVVALLAFIIHLGSASHNSIYLDESVLIYYGNLGVTDIIDYTSNGPHPQLYPLLLSLWIKLFGVGEIAVRSLSCLAMALTTGFIFNYLHQTKSLKTAALCTMLLMLSTPLHHFANESRSYALLCLFCTLSFIYAQKYLVEFRPKQALIYILVCTAAFYTHLIALPFVALMCVLLFISKQITIRQLGIFTIPFILIIPQLASLSSKKLEATFWLENPTINDVQSISEAYLNIPLLSSLLLATGCILWMLVFKKTVAKNLVYLLPIVGISGAYITSQYTPIFSEKYLIHYLPILIMSISILIMKLPHNYLKLTGSLIVLFIFGQGYSYYTEDTEDWKSAHAFIKNNYSADMCIWTVADYNYRSFAYYHNRELFKQSNDLVTDLAKENIYFAPSIDTGIYKYMQPPQILFVQAHASITDPEDITTQTLQSLYIKIDEKYFTGIKVSIWNRKN